MSSVSSIALSGMQAASASLQASATRVANPASNADLGAEAVNQIVAQADFAANAAVMRADQKMMASLLDITA